MATSPIRGAFRFLACSLLVCATVVYGPGAAFAQTQQEPPPDPVGRAPAQDQEATTKAQTPEVTPTPPVLPKDNSEGKEPKRILWIIPNYRSVGANTQLPPLALKDKFWLATQDSFPIKVKSVWQSFIAAALSEPYPGPTPEPTLFWNGDPSDLSFTRQAGGSLAQDRYHIVFWEAPYSLEGPRVVWFGMVHLDKPIRTRLGTLLTSQTIDPGLDAAREILRVDLSDTRDVELTKEFQIVMPTLSSNQFFTDGKAYIFFLK